LGFFVLGGDTGFSALRFTGLILTCDVCRSRKMNRDWISKVQARVVSILAQGIFPSRAIVFITETETLYLLMRDELKSEMDGTMRK
jgi:hypothetical protein